jgi:hypothetical protein
LFVEEGKNIDRYASSAPKWHAWGETVGFAIIGSSEVNIAK